jgi:hypothetical protein
MAKKNTPKVAVKKAAPVKKTPVKKTSNVAKVSKAQAPKVSTKGKK